MQKRAVNAGQYVLFFWLVLIFWERHAKNRAIMSILGYFWSILDFKFGANVCGKSRLVPIFTPFATMLWRGPLFCGGTNYDWVKL